MSGASAFTLTQMFGIKLSPSVGGACLLTTLIAAMVAGMVIALSIVLPRRVGAEVQFAESVRGDLEFLRLELKMLRWEVRNQSKSLQDLEMHEDGVRRGAWPGAAAAEAASQVLATEAAAERDSEVLRLRGDVLAGLEAHRQQLVAAMAEAAATARHEALEEFGQRLALELMQSRRQAREDSVRLRGAILNSSQAQHRDVVDILGEQLVALEAIQKSRMSSGAPKESSAGTFVGKGLLGFLASSMKEGDNATDSASNAGQAL